MTTMIVTCSDCRKPVRFKPVIGLLHVCLSPCERAGRHLEQAVETVGPPWRRRRQFVCHRCGATEQLKEGDPDE